MTDSRPSFIAHDPEVARQHLMDAVREHRATGGPPITIVWCQLGTATFNAAIEVAGVGDFLHALDTAVEEQKLNRDDIKNALLGAMRSNYQMRQQGRDHVVGAVLWLLCRGPQGEMIERFAREGGGMMGYEITTRPAPDGGEFANFRTLVQQHAS